MMNAPLDGLRICYFGHYDPEYSRNRIIQKALRRAGAEVIEVNDRSRGILRCSNLIRKSIGQHFDLMIVGFIGHTDVPLAKLICALKRIPIIFDAFLSLYDSNVWDRRIVRPGSLTARRLYYTDAISCRLADVVLLDTSTHIKYFKETFGISERKFRRIWIGADDEVMYPRNDSLPESVFTAFFYGSFIPLQGVEHIIEAAQILETMGEPAKFMIAGTGLTYSMVRGMAKKRGIGNVDFIGRVPYEELPLLMQRSDLCLGIFGTTPKANRVIPNKVFDALAVSRCVITADTPAIREALTHGENIWLCEAGNGRKLADAILTLKRDKNLRERIAKNGYEYFKENFSIDAIGKELVAVIKKVLNSRRGVNGNPLRRRRAPSTTSR